MQQAQQLAERGAHDVHSFAAGVGAGAAAGAGLGTGAMAGAGAGAGAGVAIAAGVRCPVAAEVGAEVEAEVGGCAMGAWAGTGAEAEAVDLAVFIEGDGSPSLSPRSLDDDGTSTAVRRGGERDEDYGAWVRSYAGAQRWGCTS